MATNMVPSINPAPLGLDALAVEEGGPDIEIEIENPEGLKIGMDTFSGLNNGILINL